MAKTYSIESIQKNNNRRFMASVFPIGKKLASVRRKMKESPYSLLTGKRYTPEETGEILRQVKENALDTVHHQIVVFPLHHEPDWNDLAGFARQNRKA